MALGQRCETKLRDSESETAKAKERAAKFTIEEYQKKRNEENRRFGDHGTRHSGVYSVVVNYYGKSCLAHFYRAMHL